MRNSNTDQLKKVSLQQPHYNKICENRVSPSNYILLQVKEIVQMVYSKSENFRKTYLHSTNIHKLYCCVF